MKQTMKWMSLLLVGAFLATAMMACNPSNGLEDDTSDWPDVEDTTEERETDPILEDDFLADAGSESESETEAETNAPYNPYPGGGDHGGGAYSGGTYPGGGDHGGGATGGGTFQPEETTEY